MAVLDGNIRIEKTTGLEVSNNIVVCHDGPVKLNEPGLFKCKLQTNYFKNQATFIDGVKNALKLEGWENIVIDLEYQISDGNIFTYVDNLVVAKIMEIYPDSDQNLIVIV
jgi:hypothetical protein